MEENKNVCPCCGRHCDLSAPNCERGEVYARTGIIPERKGHGEHGRHGAEGRGEHGARYGSEDCGEHGAHHGSRGERGGFGRHKEHKSILESESYGALDIDGKLMAMIHELRHMGRFGFDGKGGQNRIVHMLAENGAMTQRELTERLGIQPGSASEVLGKLERIGYITRTQSEADRRTTDVCLTEEGRAQASEIAAQRSAQVHEMFSVLTGEEKESFLAVMEKLNNNWFERGKERHGEPRDHKKGDRHHG